MLRSLAGASVGVVLLPGKTSGAPGTVHGGYEVVPEFGVYLACFVSIRPWRLSEFLADSQFEWFNGLTGGQSVKRLGSAA